MYDWILSNDKESIDFMADEDMFVLKAEGTGPEALVTCSEMYGRDGGRFESSRVPVRHISMLIQFYNRDVDAARMRLNRIISANELKLRYITEHRDVYITGQLESAPVYSDELPVIGQINLVCTDPYWKVGGDTTHVISGTEPCFEFPIEIDEDEGMFFGEIESALIVPIVNEGTVESSAIFTFTAVTACSNPRIENIDTGEFMQVNVDMVTGDKLVINTKIDDKTIEFTHDGVTENYFNKRAAGFTFMYIQPGVNNLKYTVDEGDEHALDITVNFDTQYGGI